MGPSGLNNSESLNIEQFALALDRRHSMFEPWERFDARKAASLMNKHRKTLRREQANLRKLLRNKSKGQTAGDTSEQVNTVRQVWRDALKDQISVCWALTRELFVINFRNYLDAFVAQSRLFATCNEVAQTLNQLSPDMKTKSGSDQPTTS